MSNKPICNVDMPDPWMLEHHGKFYLTFTLGDRVEIWQSNHLENFHNCQKTVVWHPAPNSPWSADVWAPELHYLNGSWYIYTCAAPPGVGNPGHRTVLLKSSLADPMVAHGWQFLGPLRGMPDHWAIDMTVFSINGSDLYCCWSGWPLGDHSDTQQDLFLAKMASPEEAIRDTVVCISHADQPWERPDDGRRGVNEGPSWVNTQGFQGIVYSAHGSWTSDYKLALLALVGQDPLQPSSWAKRHAPLMTSDKDRGGPFGPGHASFLPSPYNDGRVFCVYHATENHGEGWANRKARVINLGPECFRPDASPMCCAYAGTNHAGPGGSHASQGEDMKVKVGRVIDKYGDKAPASLRGLLGKARKFL